MNSTTKFGKLTGGLLKCGILLILILNTISCAQTNTWYTAVLDHGKITVQYIISERLDENGLKAPLIKYTAVTVEKVSIKNCIALMKDTSRYNELLDLKLSKRIKTISENEWVNYFYCSPGWPLTDFDWVAKMKYSMDKNTKTAVFTSTAAPSLFEKTKVKRISFDNEIYKFKDLGNGEVEVTVTIEETPAIDVPRWLLNISIPGGAADFIRKIVKLAKQN